MMSAEGILDFLDSGQEVLLWLANDGRQHLTDARLTVFRSDTDWTVFVEMPHYQAQAGGFYPWVGAVGTCWAEGYAPYGTAEAGALFEENPAHPLWISDGADSTSGRTWLGDRAGFSLILNGKIYNFAPTIQDYAEASIVFPNAKSGPGSLPPGYLLRFVCFHLGHPFFASEPALRQAMDGCRDLPMLLQTRNWRHPEALVFREQDDFLSSDFICNISCFQVLARAIASGDTTEWDRQDPATFNTNWLSLEAIRARCNVFTETEF